MRTTIFRNVNVDVICSRNIRFTWVTLYFGMVCQHMEDGRNRSIVPTGTCNKLNDVMLTLNCCQALVESLGPIHEPNLLRYLSFFCYKCVTPLFDTQPHLDMSEVYLHPRWQHLQLGYLNVRDGGDVDATLPQG